MPALLIRDFPPDLHWRLKRSAEKNRRSVTKEAVALLETALKKSPDRGDAMPIPLKGRFPLTDEFLDHAKREGRE